MREHWQDLGLVFPTGSGTLLDPANLRRALGTVTEKAGLGRWHPHELRHSAASLLCAAGVPLEEIADVLGHASTRVTSATYRHRTTPTVESALGRWTRFSAALALQRLLRQPDARANRDRRRGQPVLRRPPKWADNVRIRLLRQFVAFTLHKCQRQPRCSATRASRLGCRRGHWR
jgi:hypothetical protein